MYCTSVKGEGILFEEKSLHEISELLHTDRGKGLSEAEAARRLGDCLLYTSDHDRRTLEALKEGVIYCSVIQNCIDMGYWMVKTAVMMADGLEPGADTYPEVYDTGSTIIFQDDADEWIQKLYAES